MNIPQDGRQVVRKTEQEDRGIGLNWLPRAEPPHLNKYSRLAYFLLLLFMPSTFTLYDLLLPILETSMLTQRIKLSFKEHMILKDLGVRKRASCFFQIQLKRHLLRPAPSPFLASYLVWDFLANWYNFLKVETSWLNHNFLLKCILRKNLPWLTYDCSKDWYDKFVSVFPQHELPFFFLNIYQHTSVLCAQNFTSWEAHIW